MILGHASDLLLELAHVSMVDAVTGEVFDSKDEKETAIAEGFHSTISQLIAAGVCYLSTTIGSRSPLDRRLAGLRVARDSIVEHSNW